MRRTWPLSFAVALAAIAVAASAANAATRPDGPGATPTISPNWSGWADVANPGVQMGSVTARFRVPAVKCGANRRAASIWAGIDGINNGTVEQVGVEATCVKTRHGALVAEYSSFFEMYPQSPQARSFVSPGDSITVTVSYNRKTRHYRLSLTDNLAAHAGISVSAVCPRGRICLNASAEVVVEDLGGGPAKGWFLADFGKLSFSGISVSSGDGVRGALAGNSRWSVREITMEYRGTVMAQPSARAQRDTAFSDTYRSAG
jgi:Peptidase A4 family